jgi:hypothetical protein
MAAKTTLQIHGGDFDKKNGFFLGDYVRQEDGRMEFTGKGFVLQKDGKLVKGLEIERTSRAVRCAVKKMGGEKRFGGEGVLDDVLHNLKSGHGAFLVCFEGDRGLLATAQEETCRTIVKLKPFPSNVEAADEPEERINN